MPEEEKEEEVEEETFCTSKQFTECITNVQKSFFRYAVQV
jgi:hypothetical protein